MDNAGAPPAQPEASMRRVPDHHTLMSRDPYLAPRQPDDGADAPARDAAPDGGYLTRIPVRSINRIVIVQVAEIRRLEAEDNYVRIWTDRPYLHKETLTGLMERLDPRAFLRVHRSHAVNIRVVRELRPQVHGEYVIVLDDGTELSSGRSYRARIQQAFGLARASTED
jgi:two-component system, LytTR family, response regulator